MKEAALDDEEVCPAFVQTAEGLQLGKRVLHFPGFFVDRSSRHLACLLYTSINNEDPE